MLDDSLLVLLSQDLPAPFVQLDLQGSFDQKGIVCTSCMTSVHARSRLQVTPTNLPCAGFRREWVI